MIAGHLAGRGVTIQNPFIHFACTSFCFAGKRDVAQRGAQNSQKFGRACGMLSEIFVNKKHTPVLIATQDVVLDAHANEIALRQVSEEKEVCLKDLISRADWMRAMKASRESMKGEKQKPVSDDEDTPERLARVLNAFQKGNTIVYRIIQLFMQHKWGNVSTTDLQSASKHKKIVITDYTSWHNVHGRYNIIEKSQNDTWKLRPIIKSYLKL